MVSLYRSYSNCLWSFKLSESTEPAGGVLAALAAGNSVILKPAPETVAVAGELVAALWDGGVPTTALQFVPCLDGDESKRLITDPRVAAVILTGAWDTAQRFLQWRPDLALHGETSGKNGIVVTATADPDQAISDLLHSAFGHAGQKCSAASLAILEDSVYDDGSFLRRLADAVSSLRVGPAGDPATSMGPLIAPPGGPLADALEKLGPGESWLVAPERRDRLGYLWSPGVKTGVEPGSPFHLTECFGPVLGVMRASGLEEATTWQNSTPFGLTAGLQALDPAEIARWRDQVRSGNLYVNRGITGAIVGRQPFGGWKRSVVGPGAKAGGPNYVASLGTWPGTTSDVSGGDFRRAWAHASEAVDPSGLQAESNVFRYRPIEQVALRIGSGVSDSDVRNARAAAEAVGTAVRDVENVNALPIAGKLRILGELDDAERRRALDSGLWIDDTPVAADPAREVLRWVREQAVSESRHRHGNISDRRPGLGGRRG